MNYMIITSMTTTVALSYDDFISASYYVDRNIIKLSDETRSKFDKIKNKLGIKIPQNGKIDKISATKIVKPRGNISELFKLLNKITDKTYLKLENEIIDIILSIHNTLEVCDTFFKIVNTNSVHCHLYAKLLHNIIKKEQKYKLILCTKTTDYMNKYNHITYVSCNEDYDQYCLYIKEIDSIKNFTFFLIQCFIQGVLEISDIIELIQTLQKSVLESIYLLEATYKNEVYVSNIHILIKEMLPQLKSSTILHDWDKIIFNHEQLINIKGEGKTKKLTFKLMDISDLIN